MRLLQQPPLHEDERRRHRDDRDHHYRHELVGRHAELVGEFEQIGREHQQALRVAQHQRQPEQLEAQKEHQHAREQDRRQHHRQAHTGGDAPGIGAHGARRLLDIAAETAQRRGGVEINMRHMGQPGDHNQRSEGIEIPRHHADEAPVSYTENAVYKRQHHVAERQHHRGHEDRDQDHRLEPLPARQVGAHHQEGERGAERHRDRGHAGGEQHGGAESVPEIGVGEDEPVGVQAEPRIGLKERRGEDALVEHQRQGRQHRQRGDCDDDETINVERDRHTALPRLTDPSLRLASA